MQESDQKNNLKSSEAPSVQPPEEDFLRDESGLYGDEADIPLTLRKKKKPTAQKKKPQGKKKKKSGKGKPSALFSAKRYRKRRSLFEIMSTSGESTVFKPITIFGREIRFWPLIVLALVFLLIATVFLNNNNLEVHEQKVTIVGLAPDLEDYRMLVISDLNGKRFGDEQSSLLRAIGNLSYDAVFFLGDMVGKSGDPEPFYELLEGIPASKKVFFICGDSDPGPYLPVIRDKEAPLAQLVLEDWILGAMDRGATYVDAPVCLTVGSSDVWISPSSLLNFEATEYVTAWKEQTEQEEDGVLSGLEVDYINLPFTSYRYQIAQKFYNSLSAMENKDLFISLSHESPSRDFIASGATHTSEMGKYLPDPELLLAGHYCGGVWKLPLLGAFYIPDSTADRSGWFPAQDAVQGLSTLGGTQLYTTGGLSTNSKVPAMFFRLFNKPQISLLTLTATLPESILSDD